MLIGMPIAVVDAVRRASAAGVLAYGMPFVNSIGVVVWGVDEREPADRRSRCSCCSASCCCARAWPTACTTRCRAWLARLPGGLLHTNIGCCALFAATSGSSVATAATIGTVALPSLHERGYPMRDSSARLAAGGTLGILIPPSINMIVYGSLTNTSIGKLFIAGIIPGPAAGGLLHALHLRARSRFSRRRRRREETAAAGRARARCWRTWCRRSSSSAW